MHTTVAILKEFKIPRFIYNNKISETILTILALTPSYKTMKLSKLQFTLTFTLWGPGKPRTWLFVPGTYRNKLINLNEKDPLNYGRHSEKIM